MTDILNKIDQHIGALNLSSPGDVRFLFEEIRSRFLAELGSSIDPKVLEDVRVRWIGRNKRSIRRRILANWLKVDSPLRQQVGKNFQELLSDNGFVVKTLHDRRANWDAIPALVQDSSQYQPALTQQYSQTNITEVISPWFNEQAILPPEVASAPEDLSLPGVIRPIGSHHLIRQVFQEIEDIFFSIGFSVVEGPEIETPYYNFEALNIPEFHPVRDDMDTFYLQLPKGAPEPLLLRTHTSPMQIRTMEKRQPPVRVIVPGKVYRRDNPDATHSFIFHQVEGLAVDTDITFCDFTGTIEYFVKQFFGPGVKTRFRPSYFPFTEPSVEFDVSCIFCGGSGSAAGGGNCSKCKGAGWIELFGAGMVDPAVYGFVKYDAKKVSGFAFGMGIDRLAMLKYGIDDIQVFFQNDVRFLRQFS
jgi:phenylalanyl-tRNA synthetase alpha chain